MNPPIFARTRHTYPSYADFWRLVEVSGFKTVFVDEMDLSADVTYITTPFNGEVIHMLQDRPRRAQVILWGLEKPASWDRADNDRAVAEGKRCVDRIWMSIHGSDAIHPAFEYVLLGSHPEFFKGPLLPLAQRRYDFAHVSYVYGRRQRLYEECVAMGLQQPENLYAGATRDAHLANTKVMLTAHQFGDSEHVAPIRVALAAAFRMALLAETNVRQHASVAYGPIHMLPRILRSMVRDEPIANLQADADSLHQHLCYENPFPKCVMEKLATYG